MFEERLRLLEGAEACRATASGMAAVFAALLCKLRAGDKVVASRALFGSCYYIVNDLLPRYGIETMLVDGRDLSAWEAALGRRGQADVLREPVEPGDGDHRSRRGGAADPSRRRHFCRRQCVRDAAAAKAAGARRRCRRLFGDQAYRRPGQGARRRDPVQQRLPQERSRPVLPAYRAVAEPVQRLAAAEGPRNLGAARRAAMPHRRGHRPLSRNPPEDHARALSRPAEPPAIRAGASAR